mmetsp:Transcript_37187/g.73056  ORF Transcript_37187/g.73056 Transcript_37187/m.73056 type:complete len:607 (+) Transcript_37187:51-1871(+)|eukprot:CAMPEP_0175141128 /NCGR_PEP_ID=MMETSP0087-20121206/11917_1 /TAXON_ID=136419 /ORGANISM="Unknown Unknown, Strain D1" /LENGTH=606 /DNA_ID=CAMNT_0016424477 /DNA_START=51 /DNA_END=1871 /DNA_ORIENTATION=-
MSFFDEVETTVANTRLLQAQEFAGPIQLSFKPFEELSQYEAELRGNLTMDTVLNPDTIAHYQFKQFLRHDSKGAVAHLLDTIAEYRKSWNERPPLARIIIDSYFSKKACEVDPSAVDVQETKEQDSSFSAEFQNIVDSLPADTAELATSLVALDADGTLQQSFAAGASEAFPSQILFDPLLTLITKYLGDETLNSFTSLSHAEDEDGKSKSDHYRRYVQAKHYVKHTEITLESFHVFRVLGRGAFGAVSAVQKVDSHALFAMKEMDKKQIKRSQAEWMCINEMKVLSKLSEPTCLSLDYSFHNNESLYLVFEICQGGDLKYHLRNSPTHNFSLERSTFYAAQILAGLEHIHSYDIVYRDLKPNNILLDTKGNVKISDLGLTIKLRKNKTLKHLAGTAGYWAPEVVSRTGTYTTSDFWSFGVMLYEMLTGKRPSCSCLRKTAQWCPFGTSQSMEENAILEDGVLTLDISYEHASFTPDSVDLLKGLFNPDPKKRLGANGAAEIKAHPFFTGIDWDRIARHDANPPFVPDGSVVNTGTIGEVGELHKGKYKKIKLEEKDNEVYNDFTYINYDKLEKEIAAALQKMDQQGNDLGKLHNNNSTGGCCCVS